MHEATLSCFMSTRERSFSESLFGNLEKRTGRGRGGGLGARRRWPLREESQQVIWNENSSGDLPAKMPSESDVF